MREYRIIAVFVALIVLVVASYSVWRLAQPGAGEFDELASTRIAASCLYKAECKVNLSQLFDGDWDTFWHFNDGISDAELASALPASGLHARPGRRLVVFTREGKVVHHAYEPSNPEQAFIHQIVFQNAVRDEPITLQLPRNTWLWASPRPAATGEGSYYVLSPDLR